MKKYDKTITFLVIGIIVLSIFACLAGYMAGGGTGAYEFKSIRGEMVKVSGEGLYQYESKNQKLALGVQDMVTLVLALPLLILSMALTVKGSLKGRLLLTGTLGYFVYTYLSYTFLRIFNPMFFVYMILMTSSIFAFILCMMSFDTERFGTYVKPKMPVRFIGGYQILLALGLMATWLPPVIAYMVSGKIPINLEHYNSFGYEAIDLGLIVPTLILSAVLIIRRKSFGYLLSSVIIMLSISMNILISVLTVFQVSDGMDMPILLMLMFPVFTVITGFCLFLLLKNIKEPSRGA